MYDSKAAVLVHLLEEYTTVPYLECLAVRGMTRACGAASFRIVVARGRLASWLTTPSPQYTTVHFPFLHSQKSPHFSKVQLGHGFRTSLINTQTYDKFTDGKYRQAKKLEKTYFFVGILKATNE